MPDPVRQHYVPQWYLRGFAQDDRLFAVRLSDRGSKVVGVTSVQRIAAVGDFYTLNDPQTGKQYHVEAALGRLEAAAAEATRRLLESGPPAPNGDTRGDRAILAEYLAVQHLRTTFARSQFDAFVASMPGKYGLTADQLVPNGSVVTAPDGVEIVNRRGALGFGTRTHVEVLAAASADLAQLFFERTWCLFSLSEPALFTSDQPVGLWDEDPAERSLSPRDAAEIRWPIDRQHALVLGRAGQGREGRYVLPAEAAERVAERLNETTGRWAWEWLLDHPDGPLARRARKEAPPR